MSELRARAKLTWYLEVTGRRENGYHELRSEMTTIDVADVLEVDETADYLRVVNASGRSVASDETNIVARALALVGRRAGVVINKAIPVGGGLGGGSADAGAILRWAGGVSDEAALTLGADVPFCQRGGRALVEGVGESLTPLAFVARDVTLFMPDFAVDTADCYVAFDELVGAGWVASGSNHLEVPAGVVEPRLKTTLAWLRARYGDAVQLAGSGATMFIAGHVLGSESGARGVAHGPVGPVRLVQSATTPN